jgi:hypothetical protein
MLMFMRFQLSSRIENYYRDFSFFLSFFLSEIYLLLWEPSFVGTRVFCVFIVLRVIPKEGAD